MAQHDKLEDHPNYQSDDGSSSVEHDTYTNLVDGAIFHWTREHERWTRLCSKPSRCFWYISVWTASALLSELIWPPVGRRASENEQQQLFTRRKLWHRASGCRNSTVHLYGYEWILLWQSSMNAVSWCKWDFSALPELMQHCTCLRYHIDIKHI